MQKNNTIELQNIAIDSGFFGKIMEQMRRVVLPYQWAILCDEIADAPQSHCLENFRIAAGEKEGRFYGWCFQDTDVAKWLEAAAYSLMSQPDEALEARADAVIDLIGRAQQPDGYLNTYYSITMPDKRFTNLRDDHELYTCGHMTEAAVAYYQATGKRKLMDIMLRMIHCIDREIGPEEGKKHGYPGHPEIELALMRLYHVTGDDFLYKLAKYFIDERGTKPFYYDWEQNAFHTHRPHDIANMKEEIYVQAHCPVRNQKSIVGHCVRALYLLCGMIDVAAQSQDSVLFGTCKRLYRNATEQKMYITGGIGSTVHGEAFTFDYDLPNATAYSETCASIALIFAAQRLLEQEHDARYADDIERALFNCCLASISQDGKSFFYVNPLEADPVKNACDADRAHALVERPHWFGCACCPPNLARLLLSIGKYIFAVDEKDCIYINQYIACSAKLPLGESQVEISMESGYPFSEEVRLYPGEGAYNLALRIPNWCGGFSIKVNEEKTGYVMERGYAKLKRRWKRGDVVSAMLDMTPRRIYANPNVVEDAGKVALQRGPLVYCLEEKDNGKGLGRIALPSKARIAVEYRQDILGGTYCLTTLGMRMCDMDEKLYRYDEGQRYEAYPLIWIPYYKWANRGAGEMRVWVNEKDERLESDSVKE